MFVTSHRPARSSHALCSAWFELGISHVRCFLFAHLPPRCTSMTLDLELAKILDEFAVPEAFRTKLLDSACFKVWQFAEYVGDVKDWTSILSSLDPPIVDRMHIASVRRAYKAACARVAELLSVGATIQAKIWTHQSSQTVGAPLHLHVFGFGAFQVIAAGVRTVVLSPPPLFPRVQRTASIFNLLPTHCGYFRLLLFPMVQRTASITQLLPTHCGQCAAPGCLR